MSRRHDDAHYPMGGRGRRATRPKGSMPMPAAVLVPDNPGSKEPSMTPELQGAGNIGDTRIALQSALIQIATLTAERAQLQFANTTLTAAAKIAAERCAAAEAQLATARRALERLASMEALTSPFSMSTGPASRELNARIDYAVAALKGKETGT